MAGVALNIAQGFLLSLTFIFSVLLFVDSFERLRSLMKWWNLLAIYLAVNGIHGRGVAGSSFLSDEHDVALLMNVMLPFSVCLIAFERRWRDRLIHMGASFLTVGCIVASSSRGGFVGLVVVMAVMWISSPRKVLSLLLVGILASGYFWSPIRDIGTTWRPSTIRKRTPPRNDLSRVKYYRLTKLEV